MKTTIEVNGYEIVIEETDGMISVSAMKDGETVEEFSLEAGDGSVETTDVPSDNTEVRSFDEFEEEEDLGEEMPEGDELEEEDENEEEEEENEMPEEEEDENEENEEEEEEEEEENEAPALESFSSFMKKKSSTPVSKKMIAKKAVKTTKNK